MKKYMTQTACTELFCWYCKKFMGYIAIPVQEPEDMRNKGIELQKILRELNSFPVCDLCAATIGQTAGPSMDLSKEVL